MIKLNDYECTWVNPDTVVIAREEPFPGHFQSSVSVGGALEINGDRKLMVKYSAENYDVLHKLIQSEIERISKAARK